MRYLSAMHPLVATTTVYLSRRYFVVSEVEDANLSHCYTVIDYCNRLQYSNKEAPCQLGYSLE
jgi:hypothetical protein